MGYRHRENQEGHENGEGIKPVARQGEQSELPDHRHKRAHQRQNRQLETAEVEDQQDEGHAQGHEEVHDHFHRGIGDIPDHLGEPEDVNLDLVVLKLADLLFQLPRGLLIVELLAGHRVGFEQLREHHRAALILGGVASDDAGLADVGPNQIKVVLGRLVLGGDDVAPPKPAFHHFDEAHIRREQ